MPFFTRFLRVHRIRGAYFEPVQTGVHAARVWGGAFRIAQPNTGSAGALARSGALRFPGLGFLFVRRADLRARAPAFPVISSAPRLLYPLYFRAHLPCDHQSDHFVVADERPQRMLKRCRSVFLDEEMAYPRGPIAGNQSQRKQPPLSHRNKCYQAKNARSCSQSMKRARSGPAVLRYVMRPKFGERFELSFSHRALGCSSAPVNGSNETDRQECLSYSPNNLMKSSGKVGSTRTSCRFSSTCSRRLMPTNAVVTPGVERTN